MYRRRRTEMPGSLVSLFSCDIRVRRPSNCNAVGFCERALRVCERSVREPLISPILSPAISHDQSVWSVTHQRSEEHTSELQSHLNLVCRLLLEKKKKNVAMSKLKVKSI